MYPIKFYNLYYYKVWGGRDFQQFRDNLPEGTIGESWDIACHPNGTGIVANGYLKGKKFDEIIEEFGHDLVGENISVEKFPLLVKLINSKEKLSVQVHPGDEYAKKYENQYGKTEAWYVIDAKQGAKLIIGTKNNCNKDTFGKAIKDNRVEDYLNVIEVKKGDCFLINSGLIHGIGEGLIIAEVQQNSDVTYRVYDYGREREIHIEKSLDVANFNLKAKNFYDNEVKVMEGYSKIYFFENKYFGMEKINVSKQWKDESNKERFHILTAVEGQGIIYSDYFKEIIKKGDSYLVPAKMGKYVVEGNIEIIKSWPS